MISSSVKPQHERQRKLANDQPDVNEEQRLAYSAKWNNAYAAAMDKLAAPLLKQSGNGAHEQKAV
jgi:hypothetical protein